VTNLRVFEFINVQGFIKCRFRNCGILDLDARANLLISHDDLSLQTLSEYDCDYLFHQCLPPH